MYYLQNASLMYFILKTIPGKYNYSSNINKENEWLSQANCSSTREAQIHVSVLLNFSLEQGIEKSSELRFFKMRLKKEMKKGISRVCNSQDYKLRIRFKRNSGGPDTEISLRGGSE